MILLKATIYLIAFYVIYDRLTRSYINNSKLILLIGKKGSGKTTQLTKIALQNIKKGRKVYSTVSIPGTFHMDPQSLDKGLTIDPGSVLLIDEVGMIWDNRQFKSFSTNTRDFFKLQRHAGITCYMFSQTTDVDKKLRDLCDEIWLCKNIFRVFSLQRLIIKKIGVTKDEEGQGQLVDTYQFAGLLGGVRFTFIPRYVDFFDSYELATKPIVKDQPVPMSSLQLAMLHTSFWIRNKLRQKRISLVSSIKRGYHRKRFRKEKPEKASTGSDPSGS